MTQETDRPVVVSLNFKLNDEDVTIDVAPNRVLLDVLRNELGIISTRGTCGIGICGTCTVLLDGRVASSCIMLAAAVDGRSITTSEGLTVGSKLGRMQQAFADRGAYQCSYCIPAMALTAESCLRRHPAATVDDVRHYLQGNLCRCGTYPQILEAVTDVVGSAMTGFEAADAGE